MAVIAIHVCDSCGEKETEENPVTSHRIVIDDQGTDVDACAGCWSNWRLEEGVLQTLLANGAPVPTRRRRGRPPASEPQPPPGRGLRAVERG